MVLAVKSIEPRMTGVTVEDAACCSWATSRLIFSVTVSAVRCVVKRLRFVLTIIGAI